VIAIIDSLHRIYAMYSRYIEEFFRTYCGLWRWSIYRVQLSRWFTNSFV